MDKTLIWMQLSLALMIAAPALAQQDVYSVNTNPPQQSTSNCVGTTVQQHNWYIVTHQMLPICPPQQSSKTCVGTTAQQKNWYAVTHQMLPICPATTPIPDRYNVNTLPAQSTNTNCVGTVVQQQNWYKVTHQMLPICPQSTPPPPPPPVPVPVAPPPRQVYQPAPPRGPCSPKPSPAQQAQLRQTGNEALQTAAQMGSQADRMLTVFGQTIGAFAAQALNPGAFAAQQVQNVGILMNVLETPNNQFNAQLFKLAATTFDRAKQDPAGTLGTLAAGNVIGQGIGLTAGAGLGVCAATAQKAQQAIDKAKKATQTLNKLKKDVPASQAPVGCLPGDACGLNVQPSSVNPSGFHNACFWRAIALDQRAATGWPGWTVSHYKPDFLDVLTTGAEQVAKLKSLYGDLAFNAPGFGMLNNLAQRQGQWVSAANLQELVAAVKAGGEGSRAIVKFGRAPNGRIGQSPSHVVNMKYQNGMIHLDDSINAKGSISALQCLVDESRVGGQMSLYYFRTAGRDALRWSGH